MSVRLAGFALLLGALSACSDPCSLVVGCTDARHVAVEGRVLNPDGVAVAGVSMRLLAQYPDHVDSAVTTSDSRGLFSLSVDAPGSAAPSTSVRVVPDGRPGYVIPVPNCQPVATRGDGCVLDAVKPEPRFRGSLFYYRADNSPVTNVSLTFRRTGGALLFRDAGPGAAPLAVDSLQVTTDTQIGFAFLFPPDVWAGSLEPVIGDLVADFPTGRVVEKGFAVSPFAYFFVVGLNVEHIGPATLPPAGGR